MEFSPDTHLLLYLIPSNCRELASKASCTGLMSKQSPSGISSGQNKGKSQRLEEEREKSYTSKSETWPESKTTQKLPIFWTPFFYICFKLLSAYLFPSRLLPTDLRHIYIYAYSFHGKNKEAKKSCVLFRSKTTRGLHSVHPIDHLWDPVSMPLASVFSLVK